ncbi:AlpA family transcriptional regulator [Rhodobaculum claviforme]|uniref:Phage transcriptional regulator, AlpA n=1 Tax=Rhodobaculum claviforme TaxID=1549854 RepID=A0A934WJL7_9RHOB|nr:hypothetical protein [Rhodobaculum claviforme]
MSKPNQALEAAPQAAPISNLDVILRRPAVEAATGLSRSTIYSLMAAGNFPVPIRLGVRAVGWRRSDVTAWIDSRQTRA